MLKIKARPSPNYEERPADKEVSVLLLHYTGMQTGAEALERLCDREARVSSHYFVEEDGSVFQLVAEDQRAFHAGVSHWAGETDLNSVSIGIEIVNPGHDWGYRPFPEVQMAAVVELSRQIVERHQIPDARILGHSDVAPTRKQDPGELFDWRRLAAAGLGLWVEPPAEPGERLFGEGDAGSEILEMQRKLRRFGYGIEESGAFDALTRDVVTAFQRHYRPSHVTGHADPSTLLVLDRLLDQIGH